MSSWLDAIIIGLLITLVIFLVYRIFKSRVVLKELTDMYFQALADKALLDRKVQELYQDIENQKLANSDGFVKFLSDSRDWAFQYIEEVQTALSEFDKTIEPDIKWAQTYGTVNGPTTHSEIINKISEAYEKLKTVLPKDNQTPNN